MSSLTSCVDFCFGEICRRSPYTLTYNTELVFSLEYSFELNIAPTLNCLDTITFFYRPKNKPAVFLVADCGHGFAISVDDSTIPFNQRITTAGWDITDEEFFQKSLVSNMHGITFDFLKKSAIMIAHIFERSQIHYADKVYL